MHRSITATIPVLFIASAAAAQPNVLLLTKSSGFEHPVVQEPGGAPSLVETVIGNIVADLGGTFTATKDASLINAASLVAYDVVIFFTSGDLTTTGTDGQPAMGPDGVADIIDWTKNGGGFIAFHSASDTFHRTAPDFESPYLEFLGAEFDKHGAQFEGDVKVQAPFHPIMDGIPNPWSLHEEWYLFEEYRLNDAEVVATFDPGDEGMNQPIYDVPPYPVIWTKSPGLGRLVHCQMAHRGDTWNDAIFQTLVRNVIVWAAEPSAPQPIPALQTVGLAAAIALLLACAVLRGRFDRAHR